ncbi:MAG: hypothetical protein ACLRHQ_16170 [Sellimonas intestinalis]|uniref:hypothetical protein n=1 Tax=Sellimonas intestinalis TaxID=1653434 RepID=UPI00399EF75F
MISSDLKDYKEAPGGWEEGNTNYSYLYVDYDDGQIYSNRQEFQDIKEIDHYQEKIKKAGAYVIVTPKLAGFKSSFNNPAQVLRSGRTVLWNPTKLLAVIPITSSWPR